MPHQLWGCPMPTVGTVANVQPLTGAVLTWGGDRIRVPEGIQLEADCFLGSLPLHIGGQQRSGRATRFGQQPLRRGSLSATCSLLEG